MLRRIFDSACVAIASLTLAGCCSSAEVVRQVEIAREAQNRSRQQAELQRYLTEHKLTLIDVPNVSRPLFPPPEPETQKRGVEMRVVAQRPERGLGSSEWLMDRSPFADDPPGLAFQGAGCLSENSCRCSLHSMYKFATAPDGRVVILRLEPQIEVERVRECGECSVGCGQPSMPTPRAMFRLPVTDPARVEVVPVPFTYVDVSVSCSSPVPAP